MGWFGRSKRVEAKLQEVQATLVGLRLELDKERSDTVALRQRLHALEAPEPTADESWTPPLPDVSFDYLKALAESNAVSTAGQREDIAALRERLTTIDARLDEVTRTLTNQLNEIGQEIDRLGDSARAAADDDSRGAPIDEERLDELRTNQIRIANEQARFAKSMQEQFAALADGLRRPGH